MFVSSNSLGRAQVFRNNAYTEVKIKKADYSSVEFPVLDLCIVRLTLTQNTFEGACESLGS